MAANEKGRVKINQIGYDQIGWYVYHKSDWGWPNRMVGLA